MNQSELAVKPCNLRQAREKLRTQFTVCFDLACDWLSKQQVCSYWLDEHARAV